MLAAVFISLLFFLATPHVLRAASPEEQYLSTRDTVLRQFAQTENSADERSALATLENQLRKVIGPVKTNGFQGQGRINLLTLREGIVFGQMDGLRFGSGKKTLLVTTRELLAHYLAAHPELPMAPGELARTDDFYRLVFHADAGISSYAELPVTSGHGQTFVHAFLGLAAQETEPAVPDTIFVFVAAGNKIFVACAPAAHTIKNIPSCRETWDRHQSSQHQSNKAIQESFHADDQGFAAYRGCFASNFRKHLLFKGMQRQAQSMIDRLTQD